MWKNCSGMNKSEGKTISGHAQPRDGLVALPHASFGVGDHFRVGGQILSLTFAASSPRQSILARLRSHGHPPGNPHRQDLAIHKTPAPPQSPRRLPHRPPTRRRPRRQLPRTRGMRRQGLQITKRPLHSSPVGHNRAARALRLQTDSTTRTPGESLGRGHPPSRAGQVLIYAAGATTDAPDAAELFGLSAIDEL